MARAEAGRPDRGVVVYGLRGVGKTVLLGRMASEAEGRGWIVAQVEAGGGDFRKQLGDRLYPALHREVKPGIGQRTKRALATFSVFNVQVDSTGTWTSGIDLDPVPPPSGRLEVDLLTLFRDLAEAVAEDRRGVAVFVDDMQELDSETLAALCAAAHHASQRCQPFFICGAGLPSLPRLLSEAKSYAERLFIYERIGPLADVEAAEALRDPAIGEGVRWDQDALARVVDATGRYPYFLQEFGDACWSNAEGTDEITTADARVGIVDGQRRLDVGFFLARWGTSHEDRAQRARSSVKGTSRSAGGLKARFARTLVEGTPGSVSDAAGGLVESFVAAELRRQLVWADTPARLFRFRDRNGLEVDIVLESDDRRVAGVETKAAGSVSTGDFKGLRFLRDKLKTRFSLGVVLHTGSEAVPFGDRLWALPYSALWT